MSDWQDYQVEAAHEVLARFGYDPMATTVKLALQAAQAAKPPKHEHVWEPRGASGSGGVYKGKRDYTEYSECSCGATQSIVTTITEAPQGTEQPIFHRNAGTLFKAVCRVGNERSGKDRRGQWSCILPASLERRKSQRRSSGQVAP